MRLLTMATSLKPTDAPLRWLWPAPLAGLLFSGAI
jgi:hypothetical protein